LQDRCGKQAAAVYAKEYVASETTKDDGTRTFNYEDHYSQKLNKCFYLEVATFMDHGKWSKSLRLFGLNENKEYGSYFQSGGGLNVVNCLVGETQCASEKEWRELAKPYLGD
jgi:hypothetical protein